MKELRSGRSIVRRRIQILPVMAWYFTKEARQESIDRVALCSSSCGCSIGRNAATDPHLIRSIDYAGTDEVIGNWKIAMGVFSVHEVEQLVFDDAAAKAAAA